MNFRDIDYILAAIDSGSFAQAAALCHVSQPSLSIQIKKVEDRLGHRIFIRGKKGVRLTPFGIELAGHLRIVRDNLRDIENLARSHDSHVQRPVRLGAIATTAPYLFPYLMDVPDLILEESTTDLLLQKLLADELDAAILALPITVPTLEVYSLYDEPFLLATPERGNCAEILDLDNLNLKSSCRFLILTEEHCMANQAINLCQLNVHSQDRVFKSASLETIRKMVAKGTSDVTLMPALARQDNDGLSYTVMPPKYFRSIGLVFKANSLMRDRFLAIGEPLRQAVAQEIRTLVNKA